MLRYAIRLIIVMTMITLCGTTSNAAKKKQTFDQLCLEVLESVQSFYPVRSTQMGIHVYDDRLTDYSSASVKQIIKSLKGYRKKLRKYKTDQLTDYQRLNQKLVKSEIDVTLLNLEKIQWHKKSPQVYVDDVVDGLYFLMLPQERPMAERVLMILKRMRAVPKMLINARKNLNKPPAIFVRGSVEAIDEGARFYKEVAGELMREFPEQADRILKTSTLAQEAMNDFAAYLSEIPLNAESSFGIGKENFDYLLSSQHFLKLDSDQLLLIGEKLFDEAQQAYRDYEKIVESDHQNGGDAVFVPAAFAKQDILDYYSWETVQVKEYLQKNEIVSVPDDIADVNVAETPGFLRSMFGGITYEPAGPFDQSQQAMFYVRPIPGDLDRRQLEARYRYIHRRGFKGSVVHEAYPGHHLQMQIAGRSDDPVRKWQVNDMMIEGWALYCEEMMYQHGLYGDDPAHWLTILSGIRFRAARIIADVKLHTGQFSFEECAAWMIEQLDIETKSGRDYILSEVRRYAATPTQPMSYLMGKREIVRLREAMAQEKGEEFVLKDFHDSLLAAGSLPPALIWEIFGLTQD